MSNFFMVPCTKVVYYTPYGINIPLINRTFGECMSIPQPIEKLDPNALASGHSQERVEQVAPNAMRHDHEVPSEHDFNWAELLRIAFVALAAAAVWFRVWEPFPRISVIGILAALIGGYPIFKEAFEISPPWPSVNSSPPWSSLLSCWRLRSWRAYGRSGTTCDTGPPGFPAANRLGPSQ